MYRNNEHYPDPTASAIVGMSNQEKKQLTINNMIRFASKHGFIVTSQIELMTEQEALRAISTMQKLREQESNMSHRVSEVHRVPAEQRTAVKREKL